MTSILMKSFEKIVMSRIKSNISPKFDCDQYAYKKNRSIDDALARLTHKTLQHLEKKNSYARILFIDYSSAFNIIIPSILHKKLKHLGLSSQLCDWVLDFLTQRPQTVKIGDNVSKVLIIDTGVPQGCVLSALLFSLYTYDCQIIDDETCFLTKFADDTSIVGLISKPNDEENYRNKIKNVVEWCN